MKLLANGEWRMANGEYLRGEMNIENLQRTSDQARTQNFMHFAEVDRKISPSLTNILLLQIFYITFLFDHRNIESL